MADQGKWFKLWESALDDQELENLSVHEWFCWARLGTYLKKHGKEGILTIKSPAVALQNLLRLKSYDAIKSVILVLPGYSVEEITNETANVTNATVTLNIKCSNWSKYQGDFSTERTRRWRAKKTSHVTLQEERRRDVEENRRDVNPLPTSLPLASSTTTAANGEHLTPREKGTNPRAQGTNQRALGTNPRAVEAKATEATLKNKPRPGHYDVPDDEIMGPEEFKKIKAAIEPPELQEVGSVQDDDIFSGM